jgi:hypothetical protein
MSVPSQTSSDLSNALALRPDDAAAALGISTRTLWQWNRDGLIPCVRVGTGSRQVVLYPVDALKAWLVSQSIPKAEGGAP